MSLDETLYAVEKEWLAKVESLLLENIDFLRDLIKRTESYTIKEPLDLQAGDCEAWVQDDTLIFISQNFRFWVTDSERDFEIGYRVLDEYTREHCSKMYAVEPKGKIVIENGKLNIGNRNNFHLRFPHIK
jgi:hypothetical protein